MDFKKRNNDTVILDLNKIPDLKKRLKIPCFWSIDPDKKEIQKKECYLCSKIGTDPTCDKYMSNDPPLYQ